MDAESWMNANKAVELGFADGILKRKTEDEDMEQPLYL
jgi:ATP-dependent Clp protease protease subunit